MDNEDLMKIIECIEGMYHRELDKAEIKLLKEELNNYTYESFVENIKFPLFKKVEYFTIQKLHKIVEEAKELQEFKEHLGIKSFNELYDN